MTDPLATSPIPAADDPRRSRLSAARPGDKGVIVDVRADVTDGIDSEELLRRLLEFGFVEGARLEVLHEGAIARDPIAVRLDDMRVALRRHDAQDVWLVLDRDL